METLKKWHIVVVVMLVLVISMLAVLPGMVRNYLYFADTLDTDSTEVHYAIRNLDLKGGSLSFADLTLRRPFQFDVTNLDFKLTGLHDRATQIPMEFDMALNKSGQLTGTAKVDMVNPMNVMFEASVQGLDLVSSEYYLARPVRRGYLTMI